jgi:hypothetical protein
MWAALILKGSGEQPPAHRAVLWPVCKLALARAVADAIVLRASRAPLDANLLGTQSTHSDCAIPAEFCIDDGDHLHATFEVPVGFIGIADQSVDQVRRFPDWHEGLTFILRGLLFLGLPPAL